MLPFKVNYTIIRYHCVGSNVNTDLDCKAKVKAKDFSSKAKDKHPCV